MEEIQKKNKFVEGIRVKLCLAEVLAGNGGQWSQNYFFGRIVLNFSWN